MFPGIDISACVQFLWDRLHLDWESKNSHFIFISEQASIVARIHFADSYFRGEDINQLESYELIKYVTTLLEKLGKGETDNTSKWRYLLQA